MMMQGLAFAVSILVSNAWGRSDVPLVKEYARKGYFLILSISLIFSILVYVFRHAAVGMFTDSEEVRSAALSLLFVLFSYQLGDGLQLCFANALRGIKDVKPIMYVAFVSYFIVGIPVSYLLGFQANMGLVGIWLGFPAGLTVAGIFFCLRFYRDLSRR